MAYSWQANRRKADDILNLCPYKAEEVAQATAYDLRAIRDLR